jgi:hypothetical protein
MKVLAVLFGLIGAVSSFGTAAYVDYDLGLIFPQELGGLKYDRIEKYDNEAFGYSIFYALDAFQAEVTVYNLGRGPIPDGYKGEAVDLVFQSVEGIQKKREEGGLIAKFRKRGNTIIPTKGDFRFSNTVFQYSENPEKPVPMVQSVYVTGTHENLLKLDLKFGVIASKEARTRSQQMLIQLIKLCKAEPDDDTLLMAACEALILDPGGVGGRMAAQRVLAKTQTLGDLNVYTFLFVWPDGYRKPKNADLLVAAYFAGMLQVVVPQKLTAGGEYEAFVAMLKAYEAMRAADEIEAIEKFDEWLKVPDKKALHEELYKEAFG